MAELEELPAHFLDPFFYECVRKCAEDEELVIEFDRLSGHNLSRKGLPIELLVDDAAGRTADGIREFLEFVREFVYEPLQMEVACPGPSP